ncbi:hypothetical protein [Paragemmobacter straminiformis]|uniref:MFS transporter n=1 Tax=Paragemmobacter straminiformis TaxID=2045119 RepID=A0A842I4Q7_9RHOB|nr:hypothetical protein [Gemmobacter straminiformis]MBC2834636.1 hypothetical protein [Gemmobacter straminiformis]
MTLASVLRDPTLRLIAVALLLMGALNASVYPYQSLVGIEKIGLSEPHFALVLVMASVVAVTASVLLGILGDQRAGRRRIALATASAGALGVGLMLAAPGTLSLVLCHGLLLPVASSLYGQLFALARLARSEDGAVRDAITGTVRSAMSLSFLGMLVFWKLAFGAGVDVMAIYISALVAAVCMTTLLALFWPKDGTTRWDDQPSGLNLRAAMAEMARPQILLRVLCLGAVAASGNLYMVLTTLIFDASPVRDQGDVALYVGIVAGWEVPFMLLLPRVIGRMKRQHVLAAGAALYCVHLALLPVLADHASVWVLTLFAGLGGTAIITLPIAYYQDLLAGRPGTAGAMLAVQKLVADTMAAAAFALGTTLGGFTLTAALGATIAMTGAAALLWIDRNR